MTTTLLIELVAALLSCAGLRPLAAAQQECGTILTPEGVQIVLDRQATGVYDPPGGVASSPLYVPLTLHVVRRSDGTGGISVARLLAALDDANLAFGAAGIRFCWPGPIDYIDSDTYYFNIDTLAEINALRSTNVVPDTINIYFTQNLANESGPICGISSFTYSSVQGVVMDNDCTATATNHSTFPHEIGHYFDLFHTHETSFGVECVGCCNCNFAGDLLCDTPADPNLSGEVDSGCQYVGSDPPPCTGDPPYQPDTTNYMSYSTPVCRTTFSVQQDVRIQATLQRLRPALINSACPGEDPWILGAKLTPADGAANDGFGYSAAISGATALLGARGDDDHGSGSGSAYVFQWLGGVWTQTAKLSASDGAAGDYFGQSVAISGDTALVGAYGDDDHGEGTGSAYLFQKPGGVWTQAAKLTAPDGAAGDYFGVSVAVSGDTAVLGASADDGMRGSAYVFQKLGGVWTLAAKLTALDGAAGDYFGVSVAISGDIAVVGAVGDADHGAESGSAYVYQKLGGVWTQTAKLSASDGAAGDYFGNSVAISDDTALVGAYGDDDHGSGAGSAYVFQKAGAVWNQAAKLTAADGAAGDSFGNAVAISGGSAVVAAYGDADHGASTGSAHVFQKLGGVWTHTARLSASDGAAGDYFGQSVAISGDTALLGAFRDDDRGNDSGSAYIFVDPCTPCDTNCDGSVNGFDVDPLVAQLSGGAPCSPCAGDMNRDGSVNGFDIDDFVAALTSGGC